MNLPPVIQLRQDDTHRLVPSKYALEEQSTLSRLIDEESELQQLSELERSTDSRVLGESGLLPGIGIHELVFGVSYAHIVNAAFTYAHPAGSRFNGSERGRGTPPFDWKPPKQKRPFIEAKSCKKSTGLILRSSNMSSTSLISGQSSTRFGTVRNFANACRRTPMPARNDWRTSCLSKDLRVLSTRA